MNDIKYLDRRVLLVTGGAGSFGNATHKKFRKECDILDVLQFKKIKGHKDV